MKLGIVYTGGTIGCFYRPLRPMTTDEFSNLFDQQALPVLRSKYPRLYVKCIPFGPPSLDSTNLQPLDWHHIVTLIMTNYNDMDAFLVLHGTDTMSYSAAALAFLLTGLDAEGHRNAILNKPIIVTGSQLPLFDGDDPATASMRFNTDAFQNVCGAISCAYFGIPKVCLFFHNRLFLGTRTQKTSSNQFGAFQSPNYPPLAQVGIETSLNHGDLRVKGSSKDKLLTSATAQAQLLSQLNHFKSLGNDGVRVATFEAFPGKAEDLANQLRSCLHLDDPDKQLHGLILAAYGAGNFPSGNPHDPTKGLVYQVLKEASDKGVIIVNNTSCLSGIVDSNTYASGSWLQSVQAVSAYDMMPVALYTKLLYILGLARRFHWSHEHVRLLLTTNFTGEMIDVHCLDTFGQRELWPGESITSRDGTAQLMNDMYRGPILKVRHLETGEWGEHPVWSAVVSKARPPGVSGLGEDTADEEIGLTCILRMQSDGNLVLRNKTFDVLWESGIPRRSITEDDDDDDPPASMPYSRLELTGTAHPSGVTLRIYNYVAHVVSKQLYPEH